MKQDFEIAQQAHMLPIQDVAKKIGILEEELLFYGPYKAKVANSVFSRMSTGQKGKLVLVTAVNPTPAGEGKTTTTVGLGQAMAHMKQNCIIALREPSLGPVFGVKGGAAGGGYSQVVPMEDINLHFTGDMHAISSANNLLCALIDNHIAQGNALGLDVSKLLFPRVVDMNDRALREVIVGLGGSANGTPRQERFTITVASEVMAILCLAEDLDDLKARLGNILVGYTTDEKPVFAKQLHAEGAMATLLKDAFSPNLVQTLDNTPALMHGGPFANIAHGCNSIVATRLGLQSADYCITEAGFGSDLGAEKFLDIKCATKGLAPQCIVIVATVKALKYNAGVAIRDLERENTKALANGLCNLGRHIENMKKYGVPVVVALNAYPSDTAAETSLVSTFCAEKKARFAVSEVFAKGAKGGVLLAEQVILACEEKSNFAPIYDSQAPILDKINTVVREIYGGDGAVLSKAAQNEMERIQHLGFAHLPICIAKTQYSFSDDPSLLGAPTGFQVHVNGMKLASGAGFIVVYCGEIMTMPGLPKQPAATSIDVDINGVVTGIF